MTENLISESEFQRRVIEQIPLGSDGNQREDYTEWKCQQPKVVETELNLFEEAS